MQWRVHGEGVIFTDKMRYEGVGLLLNVILVWPTCSPAVGGLIVCE